jgi:Tol biopolymer transport system component
MGNAEFNTPSNKLAKKIANNSEITKNEKTILGILLCITCLLLIAIGQKILQNRPVARDSIMVGAHRYHRFFGTESMQYIFSFESFIFNFERSNKTDIQLSSNLSESAELSPDGQWIVFGIRESTADGLSAYRIYVMRVDGTQQTRVPIPYVGENPTWSPDGKQIAFLGYGSEPGIYIANIECLLRGESCTPAFRLLVRAPIRYQLASPDWSPDGRKIAYTTVTTSTRYISVIDVAGQSLPVRLPLLLSGTSQDPQWSPDGTKIVAICRGDISGVCVMNSDGSDLVHLKRDTTREYADQPSWSPDGQMIAFISTPLNYQIPQSCWPDGCSSILRPSSVHVMTADGKAVTRLPFEDDVVTGWFFWYP